MPRKKSNPKTARALAFGPAPVLNEEEEKAYDNLLMQVSSYVKSRRKRAPNPLS